MSHIKFTFSRGFEKNPYRPDVSIWFLPDFAKNNDVPSVKVTIEPQPLMGQSMRILDLAPGEARNLARALLLTADKVEAEYARDVPPWYRSLRKTFKCSICGKNPVDAYAGIDTCDDCLARQ